MTEANLDASPRRVESTPAVDITALYARGWLKAGDTYLFFGTAPRLPDSLGVRIEVSPAGSMALTLVDRARGRYLAACDVRLVVRGCRFGGHTCVARCGRCRRLVRRLYVREEGIACRTCLGLRYESQYVAVRWRALTRAQQRRCDLGGEPDMTQPFPPRPRYMRQAQYTALREKDRADLATWIEQAWPGGRGLGWPTSGR